LQEVGFDSEDVIDNLETLYVLILISAFIIIIILPLLYFLKKKCKIVDKLLTKLKSLFFWNGIIRFTMEGFLELSLITFINLKSMVDSNFEEKSAD
jgi:hypothetical protein